MSQRHASFAAIGLCLVLLLLLPPRARCAEDASPSSALTLAQLFDRRELEGEKRGPACWREEGAGYTIVEPSENTKGAQDIVHYDTQSGRREVWVHAAHLIPAGRAKPLRMEGHTWSPDAKKLLIFTDTRRVWRQNTRGDYWVFDRGTKRLQQLGGRAKPSTLMFATFSPDGRRVAYVCENNLFVQELADLRVAQLTTDGSKTRINGTSDWVYEEEFHLRHGFCWSPDGRRIAYWQFDTSGVPTFRLVNNTDALYPKVTVYPYPKAGQTNSACRIGIVDAAGGDTRWLDTDADPRNHYIPRMQWTPDSKAVLLQQLNRLQNTNRVLRGDARTGATRVVFADRDDAWVDVVDDWNWIRKGKRFLWLSERDGWRHLYSVSRSGKSVKLLTPGAFDAIDVSGVDEDRGCVYFTASPDNPTQSYLYTADLNGRGWPRRITPADRPGSHSYQISPDGRWAFHTFSRFDQPPATELVSLPEHRRVRTLADNAPLRDKLGQLPPCPGEFFRVDIGGGVQLDAWCIKPPDFDPARRYPLLLYVYGEPAGQTVADRWGGRTHLWHCLLAQRGYLVMSIDNRGTQTPRGREWRKCIYRQVGSLASADQAAAVRQILKDRPYIDPERIGVWGWSGGGSMSLNAIFRYPDLYRTAMAIAFISDQRLYDTVYQERYMGLPADNAAGYKHGSPVTFARQLQGNLLLVYGSGDDNCHYQNCEVLVNELVKHNKQFSMMVYPNRTHSIREGVNTQRHLFETLTRYVQENLPPGPRDRRPGNAE